MNFFKIVIKFISIMKPLDDVNKISLMKNVKLDTWMF